MVRFGIEEEFMTLDPATLAPVPRGHAVRVALERALLPSVPALRAATSEFLDCQLEVSTSPVETITQARSELNSYRQGLAAAARETDTLVAAMGTPLRTVRECAVTRSERYAVIADRLGALTGEHYFNGLHVHAEAVDAEDRVRALNAVRPWLPLLLALSVNAPFGRGGDCGFASWRSIQLRRMATMGCPPVFRDLDDYHSRIDRIIRIGAAVDRGSISWMVRLAESYPTVEVRIFDAQLGVEDTLLLAALTRSLIAQPPATAGMGSEAIDAALWVAARDGTQGRLIHPLTGEIAPVSEVSAGLLEAIGDSLRTHGDDAFVAERVEQIARMGSGAERQREAFRAGGLDGLRVLLADALTGTA